jgi:TRAF3-interacting protein 1
MLAELVWLFLHPPRMPGAMMYEILQTESYIVTDDYCVRLQIASDGARQREQAQAAAQEAEAAAGSERQRQAAAAAEAARAAEEAEAARQHQAEEERQRQQRAEAERQQQEHAARSRPAPSSGGGSSGGYRSPTELGADGSIETTMQLVQPLIAKPRLTDKLLGKPPMRFIHDVVMGVVASTGWGAGLYSPPECDADNVKEKEAKLAWLDKLVDAVGLHLHTHCSARPGKIIAGLEPERTNELLQLLAVAATDGRPSADAVRRVLAGEHQPEEGGGPIPTASSAAPATAAVASSSSTLRPPSASLGGRGAAAGGDFDAGAARPGSVHASRRTAAQQQQPQQPTAFDDGGASEFAAKRRDDGLAAGFPFGGSAAEGMQSADREPVSVPSWRGSGGGGVSSSGGPVMATQAAFPGMPPPAVGAGFSDEPAAVPPASVPRGLARPQTARRKPPKIKDETAAAEAAAEPRPAAAVTILADGALDDEDDTAAGQTGPTAGDGLFGGGGAGSAVAQDLTGAGAGKHTRDILADQRTGLGDAAEAKTDEGGGIRLGRLKRAGGDKGAAGAGGGYSAVELSQLRDAIQRLCASANPLGKGMEYVAEDVEDMKAELKAWRAEYKRRGQILFNSYFS